MGRGLGIGDAADAPPWSTSTPGLMVSAHVIGSAVKIAGPITPIQPEHRLGRERRTDGGRHIGNWSQAANKLNDASTTKARKSSKTSLLDQPPGRPAGFVSIAEIFSVPLGKSRISRAAMSGASDDFT